MNRLLLVIAFAIPLCSEAQDEAESPDIFREPEVREPGIYDSSGKKIVNLAK